MFIGQGVGSDDIMGHELTHGVTMFESGLVYLNESGAMNESLSDVFGESVDLVNGTGTDTAATRWQIGEDSSLRRDPKYGEPAAFNDPDKMTSRFWGFDRPTTAASTPTAGSATRHTSCSSTGRRSTPTR